MTIFCTYCGRGFTRNEHLQRHVLTHTNLRPFECPACHLTFTRRDLLKKHFVVHRPEDLSSIAQADDASSVPAAKLRSVAACENCARNKTKCDNRRPCPRCQAHGLACTTRNPRARRKQRGDSYSKSGTVGIEMTPPKVIEEVETSTATDAEFTHDVSISNSGEDPAFAMDNPQRSGSAPAPDSLATKVAPPQLSTSTAGMLTAAEVPFDSDSDWGKLLSPSWQYIHEVDGSTPNVDVFGAFLGLTSPVAGPAHSPSISQPIDLNPSSILSEWSNQYGQRSSTSNATWITSQEQQQQQQLAESESNHYLVRCWQAPANDERLHTSTTSPRNYDATVVGTYEMDSFAHPRDVEHWTMLQCCPMPHIVVPGRAESNLAFLEASFKCHGPWVAKTKRGGGHEASLFSDNSFSHVSLSAATREKMSAITQTFFRKSLEIHGLGVGSSPTAPGSTTYGYGFSGFILLPPSNVLEVFLENYLNFIEPHYPLLPAHSLDPNELFTNANEKGAAILLLLMIATGAMLESASKAQHLSAALVEMCRVSLTELLEKNNKLSTIPLVLQCSLLLTIQSAWGGDKWQMDIGTGHRATYLAMLRNSGYFRSQDTKSTKDITEGNLHSTWRTWIEREGRRRLAYDWVLVDQELCLFHDHPTSFTVTEFKATLPEIDELWVAKNATQWKTVLCREQGSACGDSGLASVKPPYSLRTLFQSFLEDDIDQLRFTMTPLRLRLLLYPLQILVYNHCQLLETFPDGLISVSSSKTVTRTSSLLRLDEIQCLLQRWWKMANHMSKNGHERSSMLRASLLLFHLISLNMSVAFKEMEAFARGENREAANEQLSSALCPWIQVPHEALYHCGQIFRITKETPLEMRPLWWAAGMYRATIVLWVYSIYSGQKIRQPSLYSNDYPEVSDEPAVQIDKILPDHIAVTRFLKHGRGRPQLTRYDGTTVELNNPHLTLQTCIEMLGSSDTATWFSAGVKIKLQTLMQAWAASSR